jgi:hypothetical protein
MGKFIITEQEKMRIMGLYENVVISTPEENAWCKTNVTKPDTQICIIKTPSSVDKMGCQQQTGNVARQKQYINPIVIDISESNFCKSIWEKVSS